MRWSGVVKKNRGAYVLVGLGRIYIEHGQEDMCKQPNALAEYMQRVARLYPADRFGGDGGLIEHIEHMSRACSKRIQRNEAETPFDEECGDARQSKWSILGFTFR